MSVRVSARVWEHAQQSGTPLVILLALADFADDDGIAFPSVPVLAQKGRITERHALRIVQQLDEARAIIYIPGSGRGNRSHYLILAGLTRNELHQIAARRAGDDLFIPFIERVTLLTQRVTSSTEKGDISGTQRVTFLHRSEDHFGALPSAESPISPVMIRHEIRHEDPPPPPTPTNPPPQGGGGGGGEEEKTERQPNPESLHLLAQAGVTSTTARNRAGLLPPDQVREIIRLAQARPKQHRAGWIVGECTARLNAPAPSPEEKYVPPDCPARPRSRGRAPLPHEIEARFDAAEAEAAATRRHAAP